jgi:preprotein translocase subunit SecD
MQYAVPTITCAQLNGRAPGAVDDPAARVVACERTGTEAKYLLDPAAVTASEVAGANVELQAVSGWTVTVRFTPAGQARWTALTRAAMQNTPSNQIAIVVDNQVISAPTVQAVSTGDAAISGAEIDREAARRLAAQLRSGPLPVTFAVASIRGGR